MRSYTSFGGITQGARLLAIRTREKLLGRDSLAELARLAASRPGDLDGEHRLAEERRYAAAQYALLNSPLYRSRFLAVGVTEADLRAGRGWERLPLLEKTDLQERIGELYVSGFRGRCVSIHTSGSSGRPLAVTVDTAWLARGMAAGRRGQRWWGIEPGARWVWFGGTRTWTSTDWRVHSRARAKALADRICGVTFRPFYDISDQGCREAIATVARARPEAVIGWGSALYLMAEYAQRHSLTDQLQGARVVIYSGDCASPWQRECIADAFGCPVVAEYGSSETGVIAYDCPCGLMHIGQESLYLEVLGDDGVVRPLGRGEAVVTALHAGKLPLIRYRLGDAIELVETDTPCLNGFLGKSLASLHGRCDDLIFAPSGEPVHPETFNQIFRYLPGVRRGQVREGAPGQVTILLEVLSGFATEEVSGELLARTSYWLGPEFQVTVQAVDRIPEMPSGKLRSVIGNPANRRSSEQVSLPAAEPPAKG